LAGRFPARVEPLGAESMSCRMSS